MKINVIRGIVASLTLLSAITLFAQTQHIRVFSHRGGRMEHDENTMQAFMASDRAGYTGYETDVRITKDGHMIITHDSNLESTTNGSGAVENRTLAELRALETKKGNKLLTLEELVEFLKDKKGLYVEFEMKTSPETLYPDSVLPRYVDLLYSTVMAHKPKDAEYIFTSGDTRPLRCMQQRHPDADLLLITYAPVNKATIDLCKGLGIRRLGAMMEGTSREAVTEAHRRGLTVSLWPGQSIADFMLGAYLGADYLCTDIPVQQMQWQKKHAPWLDVRY